MSSRIQSRSRSRSRSKSSSNLPIVMLVGSIPLIVLAGFGAYYYKTSKPHAKRAAAAQVAAAETKVKKTRPVERAAEAPPPGQIARVESPAPAASEPRSTPSRSSSSSSSYSSSSSFVSGSLQRVKSQAEYMTNELATDRVGWEIIDTLDTRPTLAVWLFDRTPSAAQQRSAVTGRLKEVLKGFDELKARGHKAFSRSDKGPPLLTAIAAFDKTCEILTPEPTDDTAQLTAALDRVGEASEATENTFGAIKQVIEAFLKFHTEQKRYMVLTIVSDERGDDMDQVDEIVPLVKKNLILVFGIGVPAPLGRGGTLTAQPIMELGKVVQVGPESMAPEMIDLNTRGMSLHSEMIDSGFGPFALSRLCDASEDGAYLIVRSGPGADRGNRGGGNRHFDPKIMAKYAPDYVSKADYEALLSENKCRMALHKAAMLDPVEVNTNVRLTTSFMKQDEAKLKRECDMAQHVVARIEPTLRPLYEALQPGESDRAKLKGARWQAAYDLSMGRVLAAKAKFEGYNSMVAQLKQGKRPGGPDASGWSMTPAESFSTDSTLDKMVKKSRMYLERVVQEHQGTPWEMMAQRELGAQCGWEWLPGR